MSLASALSEIVPHSSTPAKQLASQPTAGASHLSLRNPQKKGGPWPPSPSVNWFQAEESLAFLSTRFSAR